MTSKCLRVKGLIEHEFSCPKFMLSSPLKVSTINNLGKETSCSYILCKFIQNNQQERVYLVHENLQKNMWGTSYQQF